MSSEQESALLHLLKTTKVRELLNKQHLVIFQSTQTVKDVFQTLSENAILSAPVFDTRRHSFIGMIDMQDFLAFTLSMYIKGEPFVFTAKQLTDFSGTNPFIPIEDDTSLLEALKDFNTQKIHRMPVIEKNTAANVVGVLSQSTIIDWLYSHLSEFGNKLDHTVKDLNLGGLNNLSQVITANSKDSLLSAFFTLEKAKITGLPVVDSQGKLVGNISLKDIKYVINSSIQELEIPIHDFMNKVQAHELVVCTPETNFIEVIKMMHLQKVHRVHVVNQEHHPIDIITMSNVLDTVLALATGQRKR
mmetsp:Transcript_28303/g.39972  ORF Transcript_28303/g.39972 Transcript_28303/m.39972 type:complete len:303 (+) Transcript_28303:19-927(+)